MPDVEITVTRIGGTTAAESRIRHHRLTADRPEAKGGGDAGPMGGEMLLAALGSCYMSNLIEACRVREVAVTDLGVTIRGTLDGTPTRFTRIEMTVHGSGPDAQTLDKLIIIAERGCIVANTLKGAVELRIGRG